MKVSICKVNTVAKGREYEYWQVTWHIDGKRKRQNFETKAAADTHANDLREQQRAAGAAWLSLSHGERGDLMLLYQEAKKRGVTLRQAWESFKNGDNFKNVAREPRTLKVAMDEVVAAKLAAGRRERYVDSLRHYLKMFIKGRESEQVASISAGDIERWFAGRREAPSTRASNQWRISTLFGYCVRRKYISENPCDGVERIKVEQKPRTIFTPEQVKKLLEICLKTEKAMLPYFILGIFAGLRPESELLQLEWRHIDVRRGLIRIEKTKVVNHRRVVQLHRTARKWLAVCKVGKGGLIVPKQSRRRRRRVCTKAEVKWHQDIMRHTAASYLLAFHKDAAKVAVMLGHSPKILYQHYHELVGPKEAKAFWGIGP